MTREDPSRLFRDYTFSNHLVPNLVSNLFLWLVQYAFTSIILLVKIDHANFRPSWKSAITP